MKFLISIILFLAISVALLQDWLFLALVAIIIFSFRYGAAALIVLAILIDGYFGNFFQIPVLSFASIIWFIFVTQMSPVLVKFKILQA